MPESMRGTARPAAEGGYYIRYDDPVTGYVDFIQKNGRYANVKLIDTEENQIQGIAARGWAIDQRYAEKLIARLNRNKLQGFVFVEEDEVLKEEIEVLKGKVQSLLNTAEVHVSCGLIESPESRSHDFL